MTNPAAARKRAYSVTETATILDLKKKQVYWLIQNKHLAALKCGREFRIPEHEVERFLHSADVA